jgi:LEA14-like dessication related protein
MIRLWTTVTNPNPFGFTLSSLDGTLLLDDVQAATAEFPLGLPLSAGARTTTPIDLAVDFSNVPQLAGVLRRRAIARQPIAHRFDGTVGVDAGRLGTPVFGPLTLLRGSLN